MHATRHIPQPALPRLFALLFSFSLLTPAGAQSLLEMYDLARSTDNAYLSAKAQAEANLHRAEQARAGLLPTAAMTAGASQTHLSVQPYNNPAPSTERGFGTQQVAVSGSYPLYRPGNQIAFDQGQKLLEQSEAQLKAASQDLMVRISQAYFDVLAARDSLNFVLAQKKAAAEQLAAAKRNFEVGTATITDTREAQARHDLVTAQQIAAENDLRVRGLALDQAVGKSNLNPKPVAVPLALPAVSPANPEEWVKRAEQHHPNLSLLSTALDVAKLETSRARSAEKPTVDLTGSYGLVRNDMGNTSSTVSNWTQQAQVGIALTYPLYNGNSLQNRVKETLALEEKARVDLAGARNSVAQAVRTAYFGVVSGQGQVKALETAEASTQSALDATQLGYKVGVRINIDVLNAQSQLFQTKRDLAKARYEVLVGGLRLKQASGTLAEGDLAAVNTLLSK